MIVQAIIYIAMHFSCAKKLVKRLAAPVDKLYFYTIGPPEVDPLRTGAVGSFWGISQNCPSTREKIAMDQNTQTSASRGKSRHRRHRPHQPSNFQFGDPNFEVPKDGNLPRAYREFAEKNASQAKAPYER